MPRSSPNAAPRPVARQPGEGLTVSQIGGPLRRAWAWILLATLAAAAGAIAFVQLVPPRYTGEAKILLESRDAAFARSSQERGEQPLPIDEQAVASQVQVVMSRDLAREAIRRLKLVGNPEFDASVEGIGPVQRALMAIGLAQNPLDRPAEDRVLDTYFDRLLVYAAGKSRILAIEFRSKDAELAARAANTIAELYIASLEAAKVDTARYASTWLGGNIEGLRARVAEAEAKVETFRARNGLIATGGTTNQPLTALQLGELSSQLSQARAVKADLMGRAKLIKEMIKDGRAFEIPDVANNETIRRTVEQRITLRAQLALESRTLLSAHPRIKELTAQVADLDAQIKATAERVVRTMENEAKIAEARVESLSGAVDGQRDTVARGNSSEVQLRALEREAKAQREQLESYLSRYREASARDAESAAPADARVVSRAVVPEIPSFPKKLPIVALATLMGFLVSAGLVLARHLLAEPSEPPRRREPAEDEDPVRSGPGAFVYPEASLALARFAGRAMPAPAEPKPIAAVAEAAAGPAEAPASLPPASKHRAPESAYDLDPLIERLRAGGTSPGGRRILVVETTGTAAGDSPAEPGLAESLARHLAPRVRTLLVDLNGPASGPDDAGLSDLVAGEVGFLDVIQSVEGSPLHSIAPGFVEPTVLAEEPEALGITFDALAEAYDWIVCRLDSTRGGPAPDILSATAGWMAAVVIASNAAADDPDLLTLYAAAEEAGAGQVLVAQDRVAAESAADDMPLRLSSAA